MKKTDLQCKSNRRKAWWDKSGREPTRCTSGILPYWACLLLPSMMDARLQGLQLLMWTHNNTIGLPCSKASKSLNHAAPGISCSPANKHSDRHWETNRESCKPMSKSVHICFILQLIWFLSNSVEHQNKPGSFEEHRHLSLMLPSLNQSL